MTLLGEARDFVAEFMVAHGEELEPPMRLLITQEISGVTRRRTELMAWLMWRRAVEVSEVSADEMAAGDETYRLAKPTSPARNRPLCWRRYPLAAR